MQLSPDRRLAGVLAPGFAIRSANDLGIGDVDSLRQLVDWAAEAGFGLVQLLPINETGSDNSPYMAVSSVAIEPTTIHVSPESIPDLSRKEFDAMLSRIDLDRLRSGPVNYREIKPLKRSLLWKSFESFHKKELSRNTTRARKFRAFMRDNFDWLDDYTLFRVLMDRNGSGERWDLWPREQMTAAAAHEWLLKEPRARWIGIDRQRKFYAYVQWIAFTQW
ncbi:MAG: 4-alpha-glucanotransferase, partial [Verrucomicrobiota bacterium]|nr:4-alpha-glucanotransferase [Verrucomicrobiota bacterium]